MAATIFSSSCLLYFLFLSLSFVLLSATSFKAETCLLSATRLLLEFPATRFQLKRSKLTNAPSRPVVEWRKHGLICICLPPRDLTLCMDVQANPGPPLALADLRPCMPQTGIVPHERPLPADGISYSREELFSLRRRRCALDVRAHFQQLKALWSVALFQL